MMQRVLFGIALLVGVVIANFLGVMRGEHNVYRRQFATEQSLLVPILAGNPAFVDLQVREYSGGGAYLEGKVKSPVDFDSLRTAVIRAVGESKAEFIVGGVRVENGKKDPPG